MPRRSWTEATIEAELTSVVARLGRFPKRAELADLGLSGLWNAMQRRGGVAAWRERIAATPETATAAPVAHDDIARRAYFLAQERGGDPLANWLSAERELRAA
jgi:Protein of unknown function (DUF2934)